MNKPPIDIDELNRASEAKESRLYKEYIDRICKKYGMTSLQVEGLVKERKVTLADVALANDRENFKFTKLSVGRTVWNDEPFKIWYTITDRK